jgi:hypothetical protein
MRRVAAGIAGFLVGGVLATLVYVAVVRCILEAWYWSDPPNGNDFQYLGQFLFANAAEKCLPLPILVGGIWGTWIASNRGKGEPPADPSGGGH